MPLSRRSHLQQRALCSSAATIVSLQSMFKSGYLAWTIVRERAMEQVCTVYRSAFEEDRLVV